MAFFTVFGGLLQPQGVTTVVEPLPANRPPLRRLLPFAELDARDPAVLRELGLLARDARLLWYCGDEKGGVVLSDSRVTLFTLGKDEAMTHMGLDFEAIRRVDFRTGSHPLVTLEARTSATQPLESLRFYLPLGGDRPDAFVRELADRLHDHPGFEGLSTRRH